MAALGNTVDIMDGNNQNRIGATARPPGKMFMKNAVSRAKAIA